MGASFAVINCVLNAIAAGYPHIESVCNAASDPIDQYHWNGNLRTFAVRKSLKLTNRNGPFVHMFVAFGTRTPHTINPQTSRARTNRFTLLATPYYYNSIPATNSNQPQPPPRTIVMCTLLRRLRHRIAYTEAAAKQPQPQCLHSACSCSTSSLPRVSNIVVRLADILCCPRRRRRRCASSCLLAAVLFTAGFAAVRPAR